MAAAHVHSSAAFSKLECEGTTLLVCGCVEGLQITLGRVVKKVHMEASGVRENQNNFLIFVLCFID